MTYEETLEYIHAVSWKGSVPGLSRISKLCAMLGDVQKRLRFVHVAGTNGKGSVSAMTASVLRAAGYRVGLFTSPYILDFCERINIDGENISHEALCRAAERVRPFADSMEDAPTEFELITAIAFVCFAEAKCDVVVLECGMGGRLDSTNVIPSPEVSVITNVALDHTAFLGDSVEAIAREKAGIVKDAPTVAGALPPGATEAIASVCAERGVRLVRAEREIVLEDVQPTRAGIYFRYDLSGDDDTAGDAPGASGKGISADSNDALCHAHNASDTPDGGAKLFVPLCALYQVSNIRTVLAVVCELRRAGWEISPKALAEGLRTVRWRGRFEVLSEDPTVIFDGAHNPDGAAQAAATFAALYPGERAILVSGVMADKDRPAIASSLATVCDRAYTAAPGNPRALDAAAWAQCLRDAGVEATACDSVRSALASAIADARACGAVVLCAGSLYMYGEIAGGV